MDPLATNYNANATVSDGSCTYPPSPTTLKQYTPLYTKTSKPTGGEFMNNMTVVSQAVSTVDSQDPDGIKWLSWSGTEWDGVPYSGYIGPDKRGFYPELCAFLKPKGGNYAIRGLREKYYQVNPFQDVTNPTIAEIDAWNIEVIKHLRALVGNTTPISNDARLYLEARWSSERKFTNEWDTDYPDSYTCEDANKNIVSCSGRAPGPCFGVTDLAGGHCGDSFFPNTSDRTPYIQAYPVSHPELVTYNSRKSLATSVGEGSNRDIPWSIRLAAALVGIICGEGIYGHAGPIIGTDAKQLYGNAWWDKGTGTTVHLRNKWSNP
jgi:hypothetical protein